jgi:2-polyprenyl-6-hydroxyphenyl methylase / 3-demethylubiquinone-9 3-methyltransferase
MTDADANADPSSIDHFSEYASDWWEPEGPLRTLHQLNPLRLQYILSHSTLKSKEILDVGCGGGLLTEALAKQGAQMVSGLDLSLSLIEIAKNHAETMPSIFYYHESAQDHQARGQQYDVITCMELLEHVPDPEALINHCVNMLKPGGHLFISTINQHWQAFLSNIIVGEYILKILPKGSHHYEQLIKPSQLCAWMRGKNMTLKNMTGFSYRLGDKSFYLRRSLNTNYMAVFTKGEPH